MSNPDTIRFKNIDIDPNVIRKADLVGIGHQIGLEMNQKMRKSEVIDLLREHIQTVNHNNMHVHESNEDELQQRLTDMDDVTEETVINVDEFRQKLREILVALKGKEKETVLPDPDPLEETPAEKEQNLMPTRFPNYLYQQMLRDQKDFSYFTTGEVDIIPRLRPIGGEYKRFNLVETFCVDDMNESVEQFYNSIEVGRLALNPISFMKMDSKEKYKAFSKFSKRCQSIIDVQHLKDIVSTISVDDTDDKTGLLRKFDVNRVDENGKTPIMHTIECMRTMFINTHAYVKNPAEVMKFLLTADLQFPKYVKPISLEKADLDGNTPLILAVQNCMYHTNTKNKLFANTNGGISDVDYMRQIKANHGMIKYLVDPVTMVRDSRVFSPSVAESFGVTSVRDCNVNAQNKEGKTALHIAVENNCHACVKLLLNHGTGIRADIKDKRSLTALHLAVRLDNPNLVDALKNETIDMDVSDKKFKDNVFHMAARHGSESGKKRYPKSKVTIFETLIDQLKHSYVSEDHESSLSEYVGKVLSMRNEEGHTPLSIAASNLDIDMVKKLIDYDVLLTIPHEGKDYEIAEVLQDLPVPEKSNQVEARDEIIRLLQMKKNMMENKEQRQKDLEAEKNRTLLMEFSDENTAKILGKFNVEIKNLKDTIERKFKSLPDDKKSLLRKKFLHRYLTESQCTFSSMRTAREGKQYRKELRRLALALDASEIGDAMIKFDKKVIKQIDADRHQEFCSALYKFFDEKLKKDVYS